MPDATPAYMIDGPGALDRDDAISIEVDADGNRTLVVYIADLTAALDADPALAEQALERGASQYRHQVAVETMLPPDVEAACTLAEGSPRPALAVRLQLDRKGVVGTAQLSRVALSDAVALTHEQAAIAVKDRRDVHHKTLTVLREVAEALFRARYGASSAFYDFDRGLFVDEDGALVKVRAAHVVGHLIVQECMIAANCAIAEWAIRNDVPIMFRNHVAAASAPPADAHLEDLSTALHSDEPAALATWIQRAELTTRRAHYDAYPRGHRGLEVPAYCHSTSPLRRAADLITQQSIVAHLDGRPAPYTAEQIAGFCERLTVVIADAKATGNAAARQRAHDLARQILDHGADYSRMSAARFFALVKRATKEGIASAGFLGEVVRRSGADTLELRDLYHVLLLPAGEQWYAAKQACLGQVALHPELAVSLVAMHATTYGVAPPAYQHSAAGPSHGPTFAAIGTVARPDGTTIQGEPRLAPTKQAAQSQAALSVLAMLAGLPDVSSDLAPAPGATAAPADPGLPSGPMQALNHARNTKQISGLEWAIEQGVEGGHPLFRARLTARRPDGSAIEGRGHGATKKAAKAGAAADLVECLGLGAGSGKVASNA